MTELAEWTIQVTHLYRKWLHLFINESVYLNKLAEWMIQMTHLIHLWLNLCVWKNRLNRRLGDSLFFFSFSITVTHSFLMDWLNEIVFLNINEEWFEWLCFPSIIVFVSLTCLCCYGFLKCYDKTLWVCILSKFVVLNAIDFLLMSKLCIKVGFIF